MMRTFLLVSMFCFATLANAASLVINLTASPAIFEPAGITLGFGTANPTPSAYSFEGAYISTDGFTGRDYIDVVNEYTGIVLDSVFINFVSSNDGGTATQTFSENLEMGIDSGKPVPGVASLLATGSVEDLPAYLLPGDFTFGIVADSPAPEPSSVALLALGVVGILARRRAKGSGVNAK